MKLSIKKGFSFGLTSGIITTLGLIVGLHSGTHSKIIIIGGIFVIAFADSLSDALGIHISEEAENHHSRREIWESTISTLCSKFISASIFIIPFLILPLAAAIIASIILGIFLIALFSYYLAKQQNIKPWSVILEHVIITIIVIIITHYVGDLIGTFDGNIILD